MLDIFLRQKPSKLFVLLKDQNSEWHLSKLARSSDMTYVYVTKLATYFNSKGLLTIENKGKKKIVKLTEKGFALAKILDELMLLLKSYDS